MKFREFVNLKLLGNKPYMVNKIHRFQKFHPEYNFRDYFELAVAHQRLNRPDFNFIQIGANDGLMGDALHPLIRKFGLKGTCIEPLPDKYAVLTETYRDYPDVKTLNIAIHPSNSSATLYRVDKNAKDVPNWVQGIASFDRQHIATRLKRIGAPENLLVAESVPCRNMTQVCQQTGFDHLELLQIDTEGYDFEVIKMCDLRAIRPAIIRFEIKHLSESDKFDCLNHLGRHDYRMIYDRVDVIAIDQTTLA